MNTWKEGDKARVEIDSFNNIYLVCCYVESNTVFFISETTQKNYKLDTRKNKLYSWNEKVSTWDTMLDRDECRESFKKVSNDDVWLNRMNFYGD
jgi:hypothetical protein